MSITPDSAKIKFHVGSFDAVTPLNIPSDSLKNRFLLDIRKTIADQLPDWDSEFFWTWAVFKISFQGYDIHKHPQYDLTDFGPDITPVTDPDMKIYLDDTPDEDVQINKDFGIIMDSSGLPAAGKYVIDAKFVYITNEGGSAYQEFRIEADFKYEKLKPQPTHSYDSSPVAPFLTLQDKQLYVVNGVQADYSAEFALFPPQNQTVIETILNTTQFVTFNSFYTGGNEVELAVLLNYIYSTHEVITFESAYSDFTIFKIDSCAITACLKQLHLDYTNPGCFPFKKLKVSDKDMIEANAIALQLYAGRGCRESLADALERFQKICNCSCDCISDDVQLIIAADTVQQSDVVHMTLVTDTVIELGLKKVFFINLDSAIGQTLIEVNNIVEFAEYKFIFTAITGTQVATFQTNIESGTGTGFMLDPVSISDTGVNNKAMLTFFATSANKLLLQSRNDK